MAREATLYRRKSDAWIDWEDVSRPQPCLSSIIFTCDPPEQVQRTRVAVVNAYNSAELAMRASILKDLVVIMLHSVTPPGECEREQTPIDSPL